MRQLRLLFLWAWLRFFSHFLTATSLAGSIEDFQEKNTAFGNGYIKIDKEEPALFLCFLRMNGWIMYYQYAIQDISLFIDGKTEVMAEKVPHAESNRTNVLWHDARIRTKRNCIKVPVLPKNSTVRSTT